MSKTFDRRTVLIRTDVSLYRCARVRPADSADIRRLGERAVKTVTSVLIKTLGAGRLNCEGALDADVLK